MLASSKEYQDLKKEVAEFLNIDVQLIWDIHNPIRSEADYLLIGINGSRSILLKKVNSSYERIIN